MLRNSKRFVHCGSLGPIRGAPAVAWSRPGDDRGPDAISGLT